MWHEERRSSARLLIELAESDGRLLRGAALEPAYDWTIRVHLVAKSRQHSCATSSRALH